jgi:hypothetical protein
LQPSRLIDLRSHIGPRPWMLNLVLPEIGGGKATAKDLEPISERPDATAITISGLDQDTFEHFVSGYGRQFAGIHFWKCPRIADLSPLQDLPQLTHVAFYWNQRTTRLWDLSATPSLRGLHFEDFTRLNILDDLAAGSSLEELGFGNAVWVTSAYETLDPLAGLGRLRHLDFSAKHILDDRIQPLASLTALESVSFPTRLFTTEQCAWLRARLPVTATGRVLEPSMKLDKPLVNGKDTLIIGKRKPWLNSGKDAERIARYEAQFWQLVEGFRGSSGKELASRPKPR